VLGDEPPTVAFYIWALVVLLSLRPIRIAPNVELSASEVAVLAGVVLLPPGTLALVAGSARLVNDLVTRKSFIRILRNSAAQSISAGVAAMSFQLVIMSMLDRLIGGIGEVIVALPASENVLRDLSSWESAGYQRGSRTHLTTILSCRSTCWSISQPARTNRSTSSWYLRTVGYSRCIDSRSPVRPGRNSLGPRAPPIFAHNDAPRFGSSGGVGRLTRSSTA